MPCIDEGSGLRFSARIKPYCIAAHEAFQKAFGSHAVGQIDVENLYYSLPSLNRCCDALKIELSVLTLGNHPVALSRKLAYNLTLWNLLHARL